MNEKQIQEVMALVDALHYLACSMGFEWGNSGKSVDSVIAGNKAEAKRAAIESALREQQVPEGWKLVPGEPTPEMISAGVAYFQKNYQDLFTSRTHYKLMLSASPEVDRQPAQAEPSSTVTMFSVPSNPETQLQLAAIIAAQAEQPKAQQEPVRAGCFRCVTPKKCAIYGCCPGTWPSETTDQEPVHWRAVLDPAQVPHQLKQSMHVVGLREKQAAEAFVEEQETFYGWRYTLEPLYTSPQQREPMTLDQLHQGWAEVPIQHPMGLSMFRQGVRYAERFHNITKDKQ